MRRLIAVLLLSLCALSASAAESYDGCAGFIDVLPATVSTQGVWCLRQDLATAVSSGAAITITNNNVTIDCNGFKIGGLAAGASSQTTGVLAVNRLNATVRNCGLRGFRAGVRLEGQGGGHLVEDNRIDQSLAIGIVVTGDGNLVQRNRVFDSGADGASVIAIEGEADVIDNTLDGLVGADIVGIYAGGDGSEVRGNRIRHVAATDSINAIITYGSQISIVDNRIVNAGTGGGTLPSSVAIIAAGQNASFCRDNLVAGYQQGLYMCEDNGGNVVHGVP